jgi:hypothetical protein
MASRKTEEEQVSTFLSRGSSVAKNGIGMVTIPKTEGLQGVLFHVEPKDHKKRQLQVKFTDVNPQQINFEIHLQGQRLNEDVPFEFAVRDPAKQRLLKEDTTLVPVPVSVVELTMGPDNVFIDMGFVLPHVNQVTLPNDSVPMHTRVMIPMAVAVNMAQNILAALEMFQQSVPQQGGMAPNLSFRPGGGPQPSTSPIASPTLSPPNIFKEPTK